MGVLALPQLHHEHRVRVVVVDSDLVGKAAHLPESVAALGQVAHQLIAPARESAERSHIRKGHPPTVVGQRAIHYDRKANRQWQVLFLGLFSLAPLQVSARRGRGKRE